VREIGTESWKLAEDVLGGGEHFELEECKLMLELWIE